MTETSSPLDERDHKHHLFWCRSCHAPVRSFGWRGLVRIACEACGFVEQREIELSPHAREDVAAVLYREPANKKTAEPTKILTANLDALPEGYDVTSLDAGKLREAVAKKTAVPEGRKASEWELACEWEATWIAAWLAMFEAMAGRHLEARIALETALISTRTPEYRAIVLARLAVHAAARGATRLAKRWLAACPEIDLPHVRSEVDAAHAMLALARKDYWRVIDSTGGSLAGTGYAGVATYLAIVANVEACDRRGDLVVADAIMRDARKKGLLQGMTLWMSAFGLAKDALKRLNRWVQKRDSDGAAVATAIGVMLVAGASGKFEARTMLFAMAVCSAIVYALTWLTFERRAFTRLGKRFRAATTVAIVLAVVGLFAAGMLR